MKVSLKWLSELLPQAPSFDAALAGEILTQQGLEVESIEPKGREVSGVVVAEVLGSRPHPGAEKLKLVRVRAGGRQEEVVCGAPNVPAVGGRVCWAPPGARLPGALTIEPREIRGVRSPGMLCSERELGLSEEGDGILILSPSTPVGADLSAHIGFVDDVLEVNVTPNRPDALSHIGIARELAAHFQVPLRWPVAGEGPGVGSDDPRCVERGPAADVQVADPALCPRYLARFASGLKTGPSPLALRLRLAYCGMRAISNVVDVTNYVLLETGHPLHAFDLALLSGGILVRRARAGEAIVTLDGQGRVLVPEDIVIADARQAVALAGVMGGAATEVSPATTDVLLEAATFDPRSVRRTARRLGLHSEASYRFERGVDPESIPYAAERAIALIAKLGGGACLGAVVDRRAGAGERRQVKLTTARLRRLSGVAYDATFAADKLRRLGFEATVEADGVAATIPSFRPDVAAEEDLVEEVLRLGEHGRPPQKGRVESNAVSLPNPEGPADRARDLLAAAGLHEIVSWGFVPRATLRAMGGEAAEPSLVDGVVVANPISADYEVMRTSLLPGLAEALRRNLARGLRDVGLFEVGPIIRKNGPAGPPTESTHAAALLAGRAGGWLKPGDPLDFFDAKRALEDLLAGFGVLDAVLVSGPAAAPFLHPGVSAEVRLGAGSKVGCIGELNPRTAGRLGIEGPAFYFEVALEQLEGERTPLRTSPPPRFPSVTRDVSFWIAAAVEAAEVKAAFASAGEALLREVAVLEDFRDAEHVPAGKKGMLWSLTYRSDDRTLTDSEADAAHARVIRALVAKKAIQIR